MESWKAEILMVQAVDSKVVARRISIPRAEPVRKWDEGSLTSEPWRCGQYVATNSSIGSLVYMLSREFGSPVDDRTALTGRYDFKLEFTPTGICQQTTDSGDRPSVF